MIDLFRHRKDRKHAGRREHHHPADGLVAHSECESCRRGEPCEPHGTHLSGIHDRAVSAHPVDHPSLEHEPAVNSHLARVRDQIIRSHEETLHRVLAHRAKEWVENWVLDISQVAGQGFHFAGGEHLAIGGIYVENTSSVAVTVSVFLNGPQPPGAPSYFDVTQGHYKFYPVNPERGIIKIHVQVPGVVGVAPNIIRGFLTSRTAYPRAGLL